MSGHVARLSGQRRCRPDHFPPWICHWATVLVVGLRNDGQINVDATRLRLLSPSTNNSSCKNMVGMQCYVSSWLHAAYDDDDDESMTTTMMLTMMMMIGSSNFRVGKFVTQKAQGAMSSSREEISFPTLLQLPSAKCTGIVSIPLPWKSRYAHLEVIWDLTYCISIHSNGIGTWSQVYTNKLA